jgi:hypothetical protein
MMPGMRELMSLITVILLLLATNQAPGQTASCPATQPGATAPATTQPAGRVLLHQDFESQTGDWTGQITTDNVPPGSTRALAAVPTNTHWARRATVGDRRTIRAAGSTQLTFRYRISKDIPLTIYIMDRTQKDNLRYDIQKPETGKWVEVRLSVNTDFRRNDRSAGKLQVGDILTGISFLAGKTGVDEFDLAVDDVLVTARE